MGVSNGQFRQYPQGPSELRFNLILTVSLRRGHCYYYCWNQAPTTGIRLMQGQVEFYEGEEGRPVFGMSWFTYRVMPVSRQYISTREDLTMPIREVQEECRCGKVIFSNLVCKVWYFELSSCIMKI